MCAVTAVGQRRRETGAADYSINVHQYFKGFWFYRHKSFTTNNANRGNTPQVNTVTLSTRNTLVNTVTSHIYIGENLLNQTIIFGNEIFS